MQFPFENSLRLGMNIYTLLSTHDLTRFLYYAASKIDFRGKNTGSVPNINANYVKSKEIPVPSLFEQQRIVSILDTFEASIANLEAQLSQREKQYEYYRNKLLTFD